MAFSYLLFGVLVIWLCVLTYFIIWIYRFFKQLSQGVHQGDLITVLSQIVKKEEENTRMMRHYTNEIKRFEGNEKNHMQKYGFVRFNPFNDIGGDHSFALALLNGLETGFILTGLHTRERTRMYVKYIKRGKSEYDLSKEERKALEIALKD